MRHFPTLGMPAQVYQHLRQQGVAVTVAQVAAGGRAKWLAPPAQTLFERYDLSGAALRLRDDWLVGQLLAQVRDLLARLEAGPGADQPRCSRHAG